MKTTTYEDVLEFHAVHGILPELDQVPALPAPDVVEFRLRFLREETQEIADAHAAGDLVKFLDGLLDLVYVAHGTAVLAGVSPALWQALWDQVQLANLCKRRAASAAESKRGHALDVVKPPGWVSPEAVMRMLIDAYRADPDALEPHLRARSEP